VRITHVRTLTLGLATLVAAAGAWAQGGPPEGPEGMALAMGGDGPTMVNKHIQIIQAGEGFETRLVKGMPYQAETVTETVQILADGNRIVHKTPGLVARDGEGRTRREQTLADLAPFGAHGATRTVFIH